MNDSYAAIILVVMLGIWVDSKYRPESQGGGGLLSGMAITLAMLIFFLGRYQPDLLTRNVHYVAVAAIVVLSLLDVRIGRVAKAYMIFSFAASMTLVLNDFSWWAACIPPVFIFSFFLGASVSKKIKQHENAGSDKTGSENN